MNITPPETMINTGKLVSSFITELSAQIERNSNKLLGLEDPLHTQSTLCDTAAPLGQQRNTVEELLYSGVSLCLTPYQYGIGLNGMLSAKAGTGLLADRLTNALEINGYHHGVAMVITGLDESLFASRLKGVVDVLPFPDWVALHNLASKRAILNVEKMKIPNIKPSPYWTHLNGGLVSPLYAVNNTLLEGISLAESIASNAMSPIERLNALAAKQSKQLEAMQVCISELQQLFKGEVYAKRLSGTPHDMAGQLQRFDTDNQPYSTILVVLSRDPIVFLNEMLSL
ncbi:hypothetical protein HWQ46_25405 [Shewanella sp. D64]|uniref:hypothetical protein n=1 Tax=unclassified Shewanella TaxID=196818 RepID=UPI0022BA2B9E|nr:MULTISPECIES: hypothetical protein [unclassified Shewanella]MEC4728856.1 hypothetical protein [Shewanella sp. D64]MEC4740730.1 hypothetical protein [Shewanella sp. E94]WBJ95311.1 hypothetical protein HWQ47_26580 [Shewanella sp. MTB7]